jgi:CBS domain-containing protein
MLESVLIRDWMTEDVITVSPNTPIAHAHQIMKKNKIRRLVVLDDSGNMEGIITIGDVREASPSDATSLSIWELNYLWAQLEVSSVMSRKVLTATPGEPVINAARIMLDHKISGVPVVDEADDDKVVGIITESDVFRMLVKSAETEA